MFSTNDRDFKNRRRAGAFLQMQGARPGFFALAERGGRPSFRRGAVFFADEGTDFEEEEMEEYNELPPRGDGEDDDLEETVGKAEYDKLFDNLEDENDEDDDDEEEGEEEKESEDEEF